MIVVKGIFDPDTGIYEPSEGEAEDYEEARGEIGNMCYALNEMMELVTDDVEEIAEHLNISDTLSDLASLAHSINTLMDAKFKLTLAEYECYTWLCTVLKNTLANGDVIWNHRAVLLDMSLPEDWFVAQTY
jgi:uncharacterized protein YuzB (UPF0349 family)